MENLEMIRVGENGQLYIDFDALEAITSSEFIWCVKTAYDTVSNSRSFDVDIVVDRDEEGNVCYVSVYMVTFVMTRLITYFADSGRVEHYVFGNDDLVRLYRMYKGVLAK